MKNFEQFIKENKIKRKYYIFDWDDNILKMPTKIYMRNISTNKIEEFSTKGYNKIRNDENYEHIDFSFSNFKDDSFIEDTIKSLENNRFAPSWDDFIECLTNAYLFAIVTARGHEPETLKEGVKYIIYNILDKDQRNEMVSNILGFFDYYKEEDVLSKKYSEKYLIDKYLNHCSFYPITNDKIKDKFGLDFKDQEELKLRCIKEFKKKVERYNKEYPRVEMRIGFSDDDHKNAELVAKYSKEIDNFDVFYTKDKKEKL